MVVVTAAELRAGLPRVMLTWKRACPCPPTDVGVYQGRTAGLGSPRAAWALGCLCPLLESRHLVPWAIIKVSRVID